MSVDLDFIDNEYAGSLRTSQSAVHVDLAAVQYVRVGAHIYGADSGVFQEKEPEIYLDTVDDVRRPLVGEVKLRGGDDVDFRFPTGFWADNHRVRIDADCELGAGCIEEYATFGIHCPSGFRFAVLDAGPTGEDVNLEPEFCLTD